MAAILIPRRKGRKWNFSEISGTSSPTIGNTVITAQQEADLLAGNWYINIHTAENPGGEIRGQVGVVPEPATAGLMMVGLAVLGLASRRKRNIRRS